MTSLADFHEHVSAFLKGDASAEQFADRAGTSPSGHSRVRFYRTLMQRNVALILGQLHGATRIAAERHRPDSWNDLIADYARAYPPQHCDPSRFGAQLSAFLIERRAADSSLPAYLEEIADYQWCCYAVGVALTGPTSEDIGLERTLFVRQYEHAIPAYVRAALAGEAEPTEPRPKSETVLIYRDPETLRAKVYHPSLLALAVIGRRAGRAISTEGIHPERIARVEQELRRIGVLPA